MILVEEYQTTESLKLHKLAAHQVDVFQKEHLDTPIDYESLKQIGSMMGSGGLIVMDDTKCMVNIAKFYLEFTVDESCGKCTPCRIGTKRMLEILEKITNGEATKQDLEKIRRIGENYTKDFGMWIRTISTKSSNFNTKSIFREEYLEHIEEKKCRTGECKALAKKYKLILKSVEDVQNVVVIVQLEQLQESQVKHIILTRRSVLSVGLA